MTSLNCSVAPTGTASTHSHSAGSSLERRIGATLLVSHWPSTPPAPSPSMPTRVSPGQSRRTRTVTADSTRSSGEGRGLRLARRPRRDERAWYATGATTSGAAVDGVALPARERATPRPRIDATDADQPMG